MSNFSKVLTCNSCGNDSEYYYNDTKSLVPFYECKDCSEQCCGKCVKGGGIFSSDKCPSCGGDVRNLGYSHNGFY